MCLIIDVHTFRQSILEQNIPALKIYLRQFLIVYSVHHISLLFHDRKHLDLLVVVFLLPALIKNTFYFKRVKGFLVFLVGFFHSPSKYNKFLN